MRLDHAIIAGATAALTGFGGAVAVVQVSDDSGPQSQHPPATSSPTPTATASPTPTATPTTASALPTADAPPATPTTESSPAASSSDSLSEANLISEPVYFDITGHALTRKNRVGWPVLGPCTGDLEMGDVVGDDVTRLDGKLVGSGGVHVTEQLAETNTPNLAASAADTIVTLVTECDAVQGGDFGYGDPVLVSSEPHHMIWYFPAFDSDQTAGGYVVFNVGKRVGVVDVNDGVSEDAVEQLARQAARIAGR